MLGGKLDLIYRGISCWFLSEEALLLIGWRGLFSNYSKLDGICCEDKLGRDIVYGQNVSFRL